MIKFQKLLKDQSLVKVVLNGGHKELDDATIPFTLGFHEMIAEKQPTHVLVIDIHYSHYKNDSEKLDIDYAKRGLVSIGERRIYDLNKVDFIQFHKPGQHNLIFILFRNLTRKQRKDMLQKRSLRNYYDGDINLSDIEHGNLADNMVGYCEELVDIPEHFFAMIPKTGFKKGWWSWINRWFLTDPVDECEFRKRAILALTIQPIAWFLGSLLRFVVSIPVSLLVGAIHFLLFFSGQQLRYTLKNIGQMYLNFMLLYPKKKLHGVLNFDFWEDDHYAFKFYSIGKIKFGIPISPLGLALQSIFWFSYFYSLWMFWHSSLTAANAEAILYFVLSIAAAVLGVWHLALVVSTMPYKSVNKWRIKKFGSRDVESHSKIRLIIYSFIALSTVCFAITQIPWLEISSGIWTLTKSQWPIICIVLLILLLVFFSKKVRKFIKWGYSNYSDFAKWVSSTKIAKWLEFVSDKMFTPKVVIAKPYGGTAVADMPKKFVKQTRAEWLKENMNINQLPEKVDLKNVVAQTRTEQIVQKFKVSFWRQKSKVCKPYVK